MKLTTAYLSVLTLAIVSSSTAVNGFTPETTLNFDTDSATIHSSVHRFDHSVSSLSGNKRQSRTWWRGPESFRTGSLASITQALRQDHRTNSGRSRHVHDIDNSQHRHVGHRHVGHRQAHSSAFMRALNGVIQALFPSTSSTDATLLETISPSSSHNNPPGTSVLDQEKQYHIYPGAYNTSKSVLPDAFSFNPGSLMLACAALVFSLTALLSWVARTMAEGTRYKPCDVDESEKRVTEDQSVERWREKTSVVV